MADKKTFDPNLYWQTRLASHWGLDGVGFMGLGEGYNRCMYQVKGAVFRRNVRRLRLDLARCRVLDIGSGTGFVVKQWLNLGARQVVGTDLVNFAVEQLRLAYPGCAFHQLDIGQPQDGNVWPPEAFDCISALDVLFHIVDDSAYRLALANIGQMLKPGGYFFLADNFLHGPEQRGSHQVSHTLATLEAWLGAAGLQIQSRTPLYVLMNTPVDTESRWLRMWWQKLTGQLRINPRRGYWIGRSLAPLESLLTRVVSEGPSTELAICRKLPARQAT